LEIHYNTKDWEQEHKKYKDETGDINGLDFDILLLLFPKDLSLMIL